MAGKAKEFRYAVGLDRTGRVSADGQSPLDLDAAWTPEHLVLAGLVRCTLQSLRFHADPLGIDFVANASASGEPGAGGRRRGAAGAFRGVPRCP